MKYFGEYFWDAILQAGTERELVTAGHGNPQKAFKEFDINCDIFFLTHTELKMHRPHNWLTKCEHIFVIARLGE